MSIKQKLHHLNLIEIIHKQWECKSVLRIFLSHFLSKFLVTTLHWHLSLIEVDGEMKNASFSLVSKNKLTWCFPFDIFHHTSSIRDTIADNIFSYKEVVHIFHFLRMIMHWDFIMSSCCILKPCWTLLDMIFTQKVSWRNST